MRVAAGADQAGGSRVADEDRGYDQVEFVGQAGLQELRVDRAAALDQQAAHTAPGQVGQDDGQAERVAGLQDGSGPFQACGRVSPWALSGT